VAEPVTTAAAEARRIDELATGRMSGSGEKAEGGDAHRAAMKSLR
jgi:hypothetical protein